MCIKTMRTAEYDTLDGTGIGFRRSCGLSRGKSLCKLKGKETNGVNCVAVRVLGSCARAPQPTKEKQNSSATRAKAPTEASVYQLVLR